MGQLEEAQERLESALARLEDASQRVGGNSTAAQVEGELTALRQRCATLEGSTKDVSMRLDSAIEQLRSILGESNGPG
jgi:chaperonin cofactor prefoldin